jgi:hypothetical protein
MISYNIVSFSTEDWRSMIKKCSDFQAELIFEYSLKSEGIVIFFLLNFRIYAITLFPFTQKKKDQPFNRKKTTVNHLSEEK